MDALPGITPAPVSSTPGRKLGRPRKPYRTTWGEHVDGLRYRKHDQRWVIVDTGQQFREADERKAVHRARMIIGAIKGESVRIAAPVERPARVNGLRESPPLVALNEFVRKLAGGKETPTLALDKAGRTAIRSHEIDRTIVWPWLREMLLKRPEYVAQMVGIPEVARLGDLPQRGPSPTLDEVGECYRSGATITEQERAASMVWWKEFKRAVRVGTLRELDAVAVKRFRDEVKGSGLGPVAVGHKFSKVKAIVNFARKDGLDGADCRHALDAMAVLVKPPRDSDDPNPISRDDFSRLLGKAVETERDRVVAILLLGLNACMYAKELSDLKWGEITGGVLQTTRKKSRHLSKQTLRRAAVLWPQTVAALEKIRPADADKKTPVFRLSADSIREYFEKVRFDAHVSPEVKFAQLRDGSYTAAVAARVPFQHCQVLAGHSCGMSDKYVARLPSMVADACEAVRLAYFG